MEDIDIFINWLHASYVEGNFGDPGGYIRPSGILSTKDILGKIHIYEVLYCFNYSLITVIQSKQKVTCNCSHIGEIRRQISSFAPHFLLALGEVEELQVQSE